MVQSEAVITSNFAIINQKIVADPGEADYVLDKTIAYAAIASIMMVTAVVNWDWETDGPNVAGYASGKRPANGGGLINSTEKFPDGFPEDSSIKMA